jgi:hypothetical protein
LRADLKRLKRDIESGRSASAVSGSGTLASRQVNYKRRRRWVALALVPAALTVAAFLGFGTAGRDYGTC